MLDLAARLGHLVAVLCAAVGAHVDRLARPPHAAWIGDRLFVAASPPPRLPPLPPAAWDLLGHRLRRLSGRFAALYARWRSGTLPRPRAPRPSRARPAPGAGAPIRLPRAHGWVNRRIPDSAPPSGMLEALVHDPEAEAFVGAVPQAGRLLRPLCRALGIAPPAWLRLPPRPRPLRPHQAPRPRWPGGGRRPPTHPWPMLPDDRPLQAYVRRAARARRRTPA